MSQYDRREPFLSTERRPTVEKSDHAAAFDGPSPSPTRRRKPSLVEEAMAIADGLEHGGRTANEHAAVDRTRAGQSAAPSSEILLKLYEYESDLNAAHCRITALEADLANAKHEAARLSAHADGVSAQLQAATSLLDEVVAQPQAPSDQKFRGAKRAFARLYHPNGSTAEGLEKVVRAEFFKEFWRELERIERDGE